MKQILFIALLFFCCRCAAQDLPPVTQQQLEELSDLKEEEQEDDQLVQQLDYFKKHQLDLNTATADELQAFSFLTDLQIASLIRYRTLLGKFISLYELQSVPAWDLGTIRRILPFIRLGNAVSIKENLLSRTGGDQSLLLRFTRVLEKSNGYDTSVHNHYLGDRNRLMFRYRYQYKNLLYFGITGDKDAGEQFFKGAQSKGFDFYSFHLFVRKLGVIKSLAVGDFMVNMGQGLIQWQSLGFGKSSSVLQIKRQAPVLIPYRSPGEFYFNRGIGITLEKRYFEATVFASYKNVSANVVVDTVQRFTSLQTSGYHRTVAEIEDRNRIGLRSIGGTISYAKSFFRIGMNTILHRFSLPIDKADEPYNYYAIHGRDVWNSSVDYHYTFRNIHLFGEAALDKNLHRALVTGAMISLDPRADLSLLYRNIQKEYQSLSGNAFTESTSPANEKGIYIGMSLRPNGAVQLNAYADFFQFPWIRYRVNAPEAGHEYLLQLDYQPNRKAGIYVRYRAGNKPIDGTLHSVINYPEDEIRKNLRININDQISPALILRSRVEVMWYNKDDDAEQGFVGYAEALYERRKFSTGVRLLYFETDSYNSRIYTYEPDVLFSSSVPAFYDKGFHYALNFYYRLTKQIQCWFRWSQIIYSDMNTIGSGLDEINGNKKSEIKLQLRYIF
jgi:hypothetical protein